MKRLVQTYCVLVLVSFAGLIALTVHSAIATSPAHSMIGLVIAIAPATLFFVGIPLCIVVTAPVRNNQILPCVALTGIWSALLFYGWMLSLGLSTPR